MDMGNETKAEEMRGQLTAMGEKARSASYALAAMPSAVKDACLLEMAAAIEASAAEIIEANAKDLENGRARGLSQAMLDRLALDGKRIGAMAEGLRELTRLDDPVGRSLDKTVRPNGIVINKISVPLGVIGIVYESRPNVTVDAAGLCLKAGNAVILRGGSEAINSNLALAHCLNRAGVEAGMPDGTVQLVPWTDREAVGMMLKLDQYIDLIIPRGGEGLIRTVVTESTIPVIKHYKGVCHLYVDAAADFDMAVKILINGKCQRPGVCNALETLLIDRVVAETFIPMAAKALIAAGVEIRGDEMVCGMVPEARAATEQDWYEEYLDLIIAVKVVDGVAAAVAHINKYGSHHSDCIVTSDVGAAEFFQSGVDSATVYHNASTRFTDGGEFGMGAEIGISTDKIHARGPMGLAELTTYKYIISGEGQIRN